MIAWLERKNLKCSPSATRRLLKRERRQEGLEKSWASPTTKPINDGENPEGERPKGKTFREGRQLRYECAHLEKSEIRELKSRGTEISEERRKTGDFKGPDLLNKSCRNRLIERTLSEKGSAGTPQKEGSKRKSMAPLLRG